eukprot:SAG31_NODE_15258_length_763_cov_1.281627_1_plen_53_part_10
MAADGTDAVDPAHGWSAAAIQHTDGQRLTISVLDPARRAVSAIENEGTAAEIV